MAIIITRIIHLKIQVVFNRTACPHNRAILTEQKSQMEMDLVLWD
jgi:hypothetical protein